jgi:prepilin-type N-terminal cleavage/methylation domain-containing protein
MKHGFTLIELLVYMAIMGFIIVVAGKVFSDSTSMRVRSQNMLKSSEEVGKVSNLIREDISQMGVKSWWSNSSSSGSSVDVYWSRPTYDSSSYALTHLVPGKFDKLEFRKAEFDDNGKFLGVREISWFAEEGKLYRRCRTLSGGTPDADICPAQAVTIAQFKDVLIAENLKKFVFKPSKPGVKENANKEDVIFPTVANTTNNATNDHTYTFIEKGTGNNVVSGSNISGLSGRNNSSTINVRSLTMCDPKAGTNKDKYNQAYLAPTGAGNWENCSKMSLAKGETYSVQFEMPYNADDVDTLSTQFLPGYDHIAIGFRKNSGDNTELQDVSNDVLFYPPQSENAESVKRYAEFSVSKDIKDACLAITFSFCSINDANNGIMRFRNFEVLRKTDKAFHFPEDEEYASEGFATKNAAWLLAKKNVKAFELTMEIDHKGEIAGTNGMIITTPNNGAIAK